MKLRLTFNVEYAAHGVSERELSDRLAAVCDQAMSDGWLTGDTPAEVLNTQCTVRLIDNFYNLSVNWDITDISSVRPDLSEQQCLIVMQQVERNHDASQGITWEQIEEVASRVFPQVNVNTCVSYTYRDGNNCKYDERVVVAGIVTYDEIKDYLDEGYQFTPRDIGLIHPGKLQALNWPTDADHCWCEIHEADLQPTAEPYTESHVDFVRLLRDAFENDFPDQNKPL